MSDIFDEFKTSLEAAAKTRHGARAVAGHDEDFEIEIEGQAPIHVGFAGGKMTINRGPSPRREPLHFTRIQIDAASLRAILAGKKSPVDAMQEGKLFIRTRLYGGALIPILLRSACDLAREKILAAAPG